MVAIRIATVVMRVMVHHVYHVYEASPQCEGSSHKRDPAFAHKHPDRADNYRLCPYPLAEREFLISVHILP